MLMADEEVLLALSNRNRELEDALKSVKETLARVENAKAPEGAWLQLGGATRDGFGRGDIEVRVSTGGECWKWRKLTDDEKFTLLALWNGQMALWNVGK